MHYRFRAIRYSISLFAFIFLFLPISIHWEAFRFFLQATRQWCLSVLSGNSLADASRESARFLANNPTRIPAFISVHRVTAASPTCTISAPTGGATVSGASTSVTANATGATSAGTPRSVQFYLDVDPVAAYADIINGATDTQGFPAPGFDENGLLPTAHRLGTLDTTSPYGITWDTLATANGSHTLSCVTKNRYGQMTLGSPVSITVSNDIVPPVRSNGSPSTNLPAGTTQATLSLITNENATCKYATSAGTAYASMPSTFTTTGGTSHNTVVTGLSNGNSYTYSIRCQDASSNPNTDDYSITFSILNPSGDGTPPSVPQNVSAAPVISSVALTWSASTDNVAVVGYKIFRDNIQVATSATTNYTDSNLNPGTTYSYKIAAYDAAANTSTFSTPINALTTTDTTPPSVPQSVTVAATSNTTTSLSWSASTDNIGVVGYKIFRDGTQIATIAGTSFSDANLAAVTTYAYQVSAYDAANLESAHSASVAVTTTATPAQVTATKKETKKITVVIKPNRVLKNSASVIARGGSLIQYGRRFSKNAWVRLYFQRANGNYYPPKLIKTNSKGNFSISYDRVNKPVGTYLWYAVEVKTGTKSHKKDYIVYDPKKEKKPTAPKSKSSSSTTKTTKSS
ncbi:MAG: Ig-like domain-containing protein [Candidatus Moraniibacteriota bacterium]